MIESYVLRQNMGMCTDCRMCNLLLPDFLNLHRGELIVSGSNFNDPQVRASLDDAIAACPNDALSIKRSN